MAVMMRLYSDFICPFCYVAERSTVQRLTDEYDLEVDWRGFELHPEIPPGGMNIADLLPHSRPEAMHAYLREFARDFGVEGLKLTAHVPSTKRALAVAEYARAQGKLDAFRQLTMDAYWKQGRNIEDDEVLSELAAEAGLDPRAALAATRDPGFAQRLHQMRVEAADEGVPGIPTFVFDGERVVGCQPYEVLARVAEGAGAKKRAST